MFKNLSTAALGVSGSQSEIIELALSYGFKGLDLDFEEFAAQVQANGLPKSRRLLDSAKLRIGSFPLPVDLEADEATFRHQIERLRGLAELARDLGCTRTVAAMAPASDARPYHQNFEFHRKRFGDVAAALAPFDIRLGVAFLAPPHHRAEKSFQFIHSLDALLMLLGMVGKPNVGVALDAWHVHVAGGGPDAVAKLASGQIVSVQLSDAPAGMPLDDCNESSRLLPGEAGTIDSAAWLTALAERGYDGPVTPASHPDQLRGVRRDLAVKRAGEALDRAWKAAGLSPAGKLVAARK